MVAAMSDMLDYSDGSHTEPPDEHYEDGEKRTTSDSDSGGSPDPETMTFVEALVKFTAAMGELRAVGNPALHALAERHPADEDSAVFTPEFLAKCRALLAARDYHGMLDSLTKQAKIDRD